MNLTKALADRGVRDGVRVNAINPGTIVTERLQSRIDRIANEKNLSPEKAATELAAAMRVQRFGGPDEVATVVAFLVSAQAGYCQGTVIDVDGGQTRTL